MKRKKYLYTQTVNGRLMYIGVDTLSTIEKYDSPETKTSIYDQTTDEDAPKAITMLMQVLSPDGIPEKNKDGIICNETGIYYRSVYEAGKSLHTAVTSFYFHLDGKKAYSKVRGYTFRRANA